MMDHEIRKSGLGGNFCALVLELDSVPDSKEIEQKCARFSRRFPQAAARLIQTGRHYAWQHGGERSVPFYTHQHAGQAEAISQGIPATITDILNQSSPATESAPVELHLVVCGTNSQLILKWFHPACDAKGAELILYHIFGDNAGDARPPEGDQAEAVLLRIMKKWGLWQKLKLVLKSKNNIKQLDCYSSILPPLATGSAQSVGTKVMRFNESDSAQIFKLATHYAGLSGITLYFIGCMMRALEQTGGMRSGQAYCVPYALNLRKRKSLFPVFGNQVSFLFAQAPKERLSSRTALFSHLREQNKQAVKSGLDHAMLPLMQAGSYLSLDKYAQLVRQSPSGDERSSFWFSYTGSMDPLTRNIGGSAITGMYQFCQLTLPPSLGLLVNHFDNRITLSFNYIDNQFDADWLTLLNKNLTAELLDCKMHEGGDK